MKFNILLELKEFFIKPNEQLSNIKGIADRIKYFGVILLVDLLLTVVFLMLLALLQKFDNFPIEDNQINNLIKNYPLWIVFIFGAVFIPIIEELIFRFMLIFKRFYPAMILTNIFKLLHLGDRKNKLEIFWKKHYGMVFYSSAIGFALYHILNYNITSSNFIFLLVLILPQFFIGILCAYLRVKFNFLFGTMLHIFHNGIFLGLICISMIHPNKNYESHTQLYDVIISESNESSENSLCYISMNCDTIKANNADIKMIISVLLQKRPEFIELYNMPLIQNGYRLNISYISKIPNAIANRDTIKAIIRKKFLINIKDSTKSNFYCELQAINWDKFKNYISITSPDKSSCISEGDKIMISNMKINDILSRLSEHYKINCITQLNLQTRFSLILELKDFESFKNYAFEKFGWKFESKNLTYNIIMIYFNQY